MWTRSCFRDKSRTLFAEGVDADNFLLPVRTIAPVERFEAEGVRAPGLMYNEFIVYDTAQIEMKYVVVFDMDFSIELD